MMNNETNKMIDDIITKKNIEGNNSNSGKNVILY